MAFTVDPSEVICFDRSDDDLELFWLFCLVVAGKTAKTQARLLDNFLTNIPSQSSSPFNRVLFAKAHGTLLDDIKASRLGQYNRLHKAFAQSLKLNLRTCTVDDLEGVYGVGPKTARMFLMFTRPNQRFAALDTHVLKYLASRGLDVPKATPSAGPRYRALEEQFVAFADEAGKPVADFDLEIWKHYSGNA